MGAFWRYLGAAVGAAVIAMTLRGGHRAMGGAFALAAGAALLLALLEPLGQAVSTLKGIAGAAQMEEGRLALSLKLLGVSFASEFAAQACRDAGEEGMAMRVEMGGRLMLLVLAAPVLEEMAALILELTA